MPKREQSAPSNAARLAALAQGRSTQAVPDGLTGGLIYLHLTLSEWNAIGNVSARDRVRWIQMKDNCNSGENY